MNILIVDAANDNAKRFHRPPSSRGFQGEGAERALERLYRKGLTRPGKDRIATTRIEAVDCLLDAAFA